MWTRSVSSIRVLLSNLTRKDLLIMCMQRFRCGRVVLLYFNISSVFLKSYWTLFSVISTSFSVCGVGLSVVSQVQGKRSTPRGWFSTLPSSPLWEKMWKKEWAFSIFLFTFISIYKLVYKWVQYWDFNVFLCVSVSRLSLHPLPYSGVFRGPDHRSQSSHGGVRQRQDHPQRQLLSLCESCEVVMASWGRSVVLCIVMCYKERGCVCVSQGKFIRIHFGPTGKLASADIEICESHLADYTRRSLGSVAV